MSNLTHKKRIKAEKNGDKHGELMHKLMNNAICGQTMKNWTNRIDARLVSNKKDHLKWILRSNYRSLKINQALGHTKCLKIIQ